MSRYRVGKGVSAWVVVVILLSGASQGDGAPGDEFWDESFGVPGVPYEEGVVSAMLVVGDNLYVAGVFTRIGGLSTTSIARWDGADWHSLQSGIEGSVLALAQAQGALFAAGNFTDASGVPATYIATWDGVRWSDVGGGVNGIVFALASDGTNVYAGGHFTEAGGEAASKVAKWDGESWSGLGEGIIPVWQGNQWVGAVGSLAVSEREVFVGGTIRNAGGVGATNIARWDGADWHALGKGLRYYDGSGAENGGVGAVAIHQGLLYAGGTFFKAGDVGATNIARWDGTEWSSMGSANKSVRAFLSLGQDLYATGSFRMIGGVSADNIARFDGTSWWPLGSGIGGGALGDGIASNGSELLVGGLFTSAGGKPSTNIAMWHIPHALNVEQSADRVTLSWPATGTNFVLEAKNDVAGGEWFEIDDPPTLHENECVVTREVTEASQFYRLRRR